mmetsp:Transcript_46078/g.98530  ORF Transcript_46078/g.98530 Transcript_46078/m.98530 type:complete len:555 (+) Transcript_46078:45-1709(+)
MSSPGRGASFGSPQWSAVELYDRIHDLEKKLSSERASRREEVAFLTRIHQKELTAFQARIAEAGDELHRERHTHGEALGAQLEHLDHLRRQVSSQDEKIGQLERARQAQAQQIGELNQMVGMLQAEAHEKVARVQVSLGAQAPRETSPEALVQCADSLRRQWESAEDLASSQSQGLREEASAHDARVADLTASNSRLEHEGRVLRNSLQELKGSVRVLCRMRPPNRGDGTAVTQDGKNLVLRPPQFDRDMEFSFDKVFGTASQQGEVYKEVEGLVRSTLDGFTSMIFAYGQTGSGKTFTIDGTAEHPGVQRRALEQLLCTCPPDCSIAMSVVEVYNDAVRDLLGGNPKELMDVRQSAEGMPDTPGSVSMFGCVSVPGLCCQTVASEEEARELLATARANRAVGSTQLNSRSSRSHLILSLAVVRSISGVPLGFLHLCDLAGSERTKLSLAEGDRMKEANHINKSLSALGDVLHALANKSSHVPYRNSKLTSLLRDCLGGNSKVLMLAQASSDACDLSETFSTLSFAARVKTIEKGKITKATHLKDDPPKTKRHH